MEVKSRIYTPGWKVTPLPQGLVGLTHDLMPHIAKHSIASNDALVSNVYVIQVCSQQVDSTW